jgi:hypothetical protein
MVLLFAGWVLLIPADELPTFCWFTLWVFLFGFLLNIWYKLLHSVFYAHFTEPSFIYPELVLMLLESAVGDGFISLSWHNAWSFSRLRRILCATPAKRRSRKQARFP